MARARFNSSSGFSLVEVLIAMGLLTIVSLSVAQLFAISTHANHVAKGQTSTTVLAEQKVEQLRALTWGFDRQGQGLPVSDTSTNLAVFPPQASGSGLNPSPMNALDENTIGYVDYLDSQGTYVGTGSTPPAAAAFIRRWSIQPLPTNPNNTLILQVLVTSVVAEGSRVSVVGPRRRMPGDTLIVAVKTRKSQ
jgi:prepilin-type N-terminal cleavage/methylation domain-containing protein